MNLFDVLTLEATGDGICDAAVLMVYERPDAGRGQIRSGKYVESQLGQRSPAPSIISKPAEWTELLNRPAHHRPDRRRLCLGLPRLPSRRPELARRATCTHRLVRRICRAPLDAGHKARRLNLMHPNPAFRQTPEDRNLAFARERGFGVLALAGDEPLLSHVPFLLAVDGSHADLHLVRSNPIARAGGGNAVIAVTGP